MIQVTILQAILGSTMAWVYASILLLLIILLLLVTPYFGIYGTRDPFPEERDVSSNGSTEGD